MQLSNYKTLSPPSLQFAALLSVCKFEEWTAAQEVQVVENSFPVIEEEDYN